MLNSYIMMGGGGEPICRVRNNSYKLGSIIRPPQNRQRVAGRMCFTLPDSILRRREHAISELEITNGLSDRYEPIIFPFFFYFSSSRLL
jgi:hypothetical protein